MRIAIPYNADTHLKPHLNSVERLAEDDVASLADDVFAALSGAHVCRLVPIEDCLFTGVEAIRAFRPDMIVNLCESVRGHTRGEAHFAYVLDMLGLPYCGCDAVTLALCQDKAVLKRLFDRSGVLTPPGVDLAPGCPIDQATQGITDMLARAGRVIVKPVREDGGLGIHRDSVVSDVASALAGVRDIWARFHQPALVEAFIAGPEFNIAFYHGRDGLVALPPGAVRFAAGIRVEQHVVGYRHKWDADSLEYQSFEVNTTRDLDPRIHAEIVRTCSRAVNALGGAGYYRFDVRQGADGRIYVLDVNPHPDIGSTAGFRTALTAAGIPFAEFLEELIEVRLRRPKPAAAAAALQRLG